MKLNNKSAAIAAAIVGGSMLALSLTHLTHGLSLITGDHVVLSFLLALGIDMGMVAFKVASVVASGRPVWEEIRAYNTTGLIACLTISGLLNVLSYVQGKDVGSFEWLLSVALGVFIPGSVYCLSQVAAKLWLNGAKRKPTKRKPATRKKT